jgi:hypothetical protein
VANYHHKSIKKFFLDGVIHDESSIGRLKIEYIRLLVSEMRLSGYVPRFDIDPDFTIDYNETKRSFYFALTVHGVHVGKRNSEWISGIDGNKPIYIQKNKSKESSQAQV